MAYTGPLAPCPSCGTDMPEPRLRLVDVTRGVCAACNAQRADADPYVQVCYGFKNNGANLVRQSQLRAHMEGVKVRG